MSLGHFHFAPRTCFSWTGIGIANHNIMDNLSQLHCVFDILSGALYTLTFEAHRLLPAWLLSARESCWRNVEEFARNMPRGQWRHSAGRRDFNDSAKNWIPGSENHNSSRSATSHNPTCAWSNRWTETTARVVFFIVTADIRRGTPTFVVRSGLANMAPEVADWTVLRFSSPASHVPGHGGVSPIWSAVKEIRQAGEEKNKTGPITHNCSPLLLSASRRGVGECGGITLPRQVPETPPPSTDDMWWLVGVGTGALGAPKSA